MFGRNERLAVVTGGIGGLGSEICKYLARSGRRVIAADLDSQPARVDVFRQSVLEFGDQIAFEAVDVASFDSCSDFFAQPCLPIDRFCG